VTIEQGDIISIENMKGFFLITSKNFFNASEQAIVCPIVADTFLDPLHIEINSDEVKGIVMCEQMRLVDLRYRGYKRVDRLHYADIIDITDAIQSIFDY
jgi:mRNA-degrading endonuclease toxin of MazEF toxin-antitoxin module